MNEDRAISRLLLVWGILALVAPAARAEGPGILLGDRLVLHPGLAAELRYDSNLFYSNGRAGEGFPTGAPVLRILPSVDLTTVSISRGGLSPQKFDFRLHLGLDYREYLSTDSFVSQHRDVGADLGALVKLFPRGAFNIDLYDNFLRSNQLPYNPYPTSQGVADAANPYRSYNFDRDTNVFGLRGRYSPGGQRLTFSLLWELGFDGFENVANGVQLSLLNQLNSQINLRASWKFLPKTAFYVDADSNVQHYLAAATSQLVPRPDSHPVRVGGGMMGLITQKFSVDLFGGYGYGFYTYQGGCPKDPGDTCNPSTAVVRAEVRYKPTFLSSVSANFRHDFANSLIGSYFILNSISLTYSQLLFRTNLLARVTWDRMEFYGPGVLLQTAGVCQNGEIMPCIPQRDRADNYIVADLKAEYPLREWLVPSLGYSLQTNLSNGYNLIHSVIVPVTFIKHELWIRLTVRY